MPHTPKQNGIAKHANEKILDKGHTIMKDTNAPDFLWADAFATAVYVINRTAGSCSSSMTPFEAFFGDKPDVSHMWVWYSDVFIHQPKGLGAGKLGEWGHQVKFLGYPDNSAGYRTYDPCAHKVQVVCALIFREEACPTPLSSFESPANDSDAEDDPHDIPNSAPAPSAVPNPSLPPLTPVHPAPPSTPPSPGHPVQER